MENKPLFIFEMANNHNGSVELGKRIIRELKEVTKLFDFRFAVKLQYRNLETCIHPAYRNRMDLKYIKRFTETHLSWDQYKELKDAIVEAGFLSICTPWDEASVEKIVEHGFDYIKIPSCYLTDWPLIEAIGKHDLPIIASTAALPLDQIDRTVSFFAHRKKSLALMHCVGEYPTPEGHLHLGQISLLKKRYPNLDIGYSTHEFPYISGPIQIAIALGAVLFEKHVGIPPTNTYSAEPREIAGWLTAAQRAFEMIGQSERYTPSADELKSMHDLARGAYARSEIKAGDIVKDVFFAMPPARLVAQDFSKYTQFTANKDINVNEPIDDVCALNNNQAVQGIVNSVKSLIRKSRVAVPGQCELEISHHYGLHRFREVGIAAITVVNAGYCKRLLVVLPGQDHPEQWHEKKDETYHLLYGDLNVELDGAYSSHNVNDIVTIPHGVRHSFWSPKGAVIEEISSSYDPNDSFYTDESINKNQNRKTFVSYWM